MPQERRQHRKSHEESEGTDAASGSGSTTERKAKLDDDIDAILEDIDEVLESNAEEFVKSFIQKGGQ